MIQTNLDLRKVRILIPAQTMKEIGEKYRMRRNRTVVSGRQMHDLSAMPPLKQKTIDRKRKKGRRMPEVALVDTYNMVSRSALNLEAKDGQLTITQGPTRAEIAKYHNEGGEHLPQRVHLSFNQDFVNEDVMPLIELAVDKAIRNAFGDVRYG